MMSRLALAGVFGILSVTVSFAQETDSKPLPSPLTLEYALTLADQAHPDLELAHARLKLSEANEATTKAETGLDITTEIRPQYVQPANPIFGPQTSDNQAHLYLTKRLYDFGATSTRREAAKLTVDSSKYAYLDARQKRRLEIMRRFFDVLLADMRYMVDNEAMAHTFVKYDRVRERHRLGRISDVDLAASETSYREQLVRRTRAQIDQRATRQQLAIVLNRPGQLSATLTQPAIKGNDRKIPEFDELLKRVQAANPTAQGLRKEVEAAELAMKVARKKRGPTIDAELQGSYFERNIGSRDNWRAGINLRVPLYQGGKVDAEIAQMDAHLHNKRAELKKTEYDLRQHLLTLLQKLELLTVERETARIRSDYRDLYLDRSRALYEMEAQVSLGDAMTKLTEAQWRAARVEFELAMTWAQIDALGGLLVTNNSAKQ